MSQKIKEECHLVKEAFDNCQSSLQETIGNRRKLQKHFTGFLDQLTSVTTEVRQQATENEARLNDFVKTLDDLQKVKNPPKSFETIETESQLLSDELAKDARQMPNIMSNTNGEKMLSISIEIKDTINNRLDRIPLFDHGSSVDDPNIGEHYRSHMSLLSTLVIDFISRHHPIL